MTDKTAAPDAVQAPSLPLFYQQPRPLDRVRHAAARLLEPADLGFAAPANNLPVLIEEFAHAGHVYPIVFTLGDVPNSGRLAGSARPQNLFLRQRDDTWTWAADTYIPAYVRRYPLILMEMQTAGEFTVCIDEAADGAKGAAVVHGGWRVVRSRQERRRLLPGLSEPDRRHDGVHGGPEEA